MVRLGPFILFLSPVIIHPCQGVFANHHLNRLNDKLKARALSIDDLVTDLSDGVSPYLQSIAFSK